MDNIAKCAPVSVMLRAFANLLETRIIFTQSPSVLILVNLAVTQRLNALLASNTELRQLSSKAEQLMAMQRHYELIAPPSLRNSSRVFQLRSHVVVIAASNGAVAAKLRQMTSELISLFQARGCEVTGIQIRVQVGPHPSASTPKPRVLSKAARDALDELGNELADSPLKSALRRLGHKGQ